MDEANPRRKTLVDALAESESSALQKYQDLYVGSRSLAALMRYELATLFLTNVPGAWGLLLRKRFYKGLFARVGQNLLIGPHVTLRSPGNITLGSDIFIDANAVLDAKGEQSALTLGDAVLVGRNSVLSCAQARIEIGDDVSIGPFCHIRAGLCPIRLGSNITLGSHTAIISGNPGYDRLDIPMKHQVGTTLGVQVQDDVWIGVGVRIIDGVTIGAGSVVGAGAVVVDDVPPMAIVAGVPARVLSWRAGQ